jgi:hypothetical protein
MRRAGVYCNLFWLLFSLVVCTEAFRLKLGAINNPGPGFFPFSAGLVLLILSLAALFQSIGKRGRKETAGREEPYRWWNIAIILAAIIAYTLSLERIGFLINTFLFITILLKIIEPQNWKTSVLGGLITAVAANLVFNVIFRAQIPSGILGF